ncbi:MAG: hypothetical protein J6Y33_04960 [Prevotella sp.]|nr:hypothetical protein [Prevotella sp.]
MKTGKRMMMVALMGYMVMLLAGCLAENKLKLAVEAANKRCPFSMGAAGDLESIEYEDGLVTYTLAINEQFSNLKAMSENPDVVRRTIMTNFTNPGSDLKAMHDLILDANASVKYVYKGKSGGESFEVTFTADELKAAEDNTNPSAEDKLYAEIEATNMQLPMQVDEVTVLEKMVVEGNSVVYLYQVDESIVSIDDMRNNTDATKENLKNSLKNGGPLVQAFLKKVIDTGRDLRYRYTGSESGETTEVVFTPADLQNILQ